MRLIQEERGATVATHVYEPGSYVPLARIDRHTAPAALGAPAETTTAVHYLHTNINGAPEEMTDARGALIWQARYAVWGNTVAEHWHREHRPDISGVSLAHPIPQNLRMQGQYADPETGLCYNTFRYYDPDIGRFISQDPIGLAGGMNLYQYAPNPISWIDPWGWVPGDYGKMPNIPGYQKHHNIPQSMADHPAITQSGYDVNNSRNITHLPRTGATDPARTVHNGKHSREYDRMVRRELDKIARSKASPAIKKMQVQQVSDDIGGKLRTNKTKLNRSC